MSPFPLVPTRQERISSCKTLPSRSRRTGWRWERSPERLLWSQHQPPLRSQSKIKGEKNSNCVSAT